MASEEFEFWQGVSRRERQDRRKAYDYEAATKAATGTVNQLDDDLCIYSCKKCGKEHTLIDFIKETNGICLEGRDRTSNGCKGTEFIQGNYAVSKGGCYHFIPVPIGQSWERARALYWGDENPPEK